MMSNTEKNAIRLADPDDIWAGYDVDRVLNALRLSAGALVGVDREQLLRDIKEQRGQNSSPQD